MKWEEAPTLRTIVRSDLAALEGIWSRDSTNDELRVGSAILRRLVVEDLLGQAWHAVGFSGHPTIRATSWNDRNFPQLGHIDLSKTLVAVMSTPYFLGGLHPLPEPISWNEFRNATFLIVNGVEISRTLLIRYVTNKLGGVHFDQRRTSRDPVSFVSLDSLQMAIYGRQEPYAQLLEIGLGLLASEDIARLRERLEAGTNKQA